MATPLFDKEVVKLRRRLGDIFNEDGTEITTANVGSASTIGMEWKRDELQDIYNDSVRLFIGYLSTAFPKEMWYVFTHGYVIHKVNLTLASGQVNFETLDPSGYAIIDLMKNGATDVTGLAVEIVPSQWFSYKVGAVKTRKPDAGHIFYCLLTEGTAASNTRFLNVLPTSITAIDLVYLRQHQDIVHGGSPDLTGISEDALRRVQIFAEAEARRYKSKSQEDLPEVRLAMMIKSDAQLVVSSRG